MTKSIIKLKKADLTLGNAAASVHVLKNIDLSIDEGKRSVSSALPVRENRLC